MTRLDGSQFASFFEALHGYEPFPWQRRLARSILETGSWPHLLDIPTGLGKTSVIDVALFVLAARPEIAPRRILMVVDRRVVVDQAFEHAHRIQGKLAAATEGILRTVADCLRELWRGPSDAAPFEVGVLRGGMPRDESWAHRPDRPVVAASTVDQVGSRLLFRGYGVSPTMAPIHAGLLGNDALILLDEVQLSTAFAETLRAVAERWRGWRERDDEQGQRARHLPDRWAFVCMSATPVSEASARDVRVSLDDEDHAHPVVRQRLRASKLARLAELIPTTKTDAEKTMRAVVDAFTQHAMNHLDAGARRLAVIVNRVATARRIHEALKQRTKDRADVALLTGRMRPLDRDAIFGDPADLTSVAGRVVAGCPRTPEQRPIIVVSTQTIEAGADLDFDALVTECASIDALRQRFGRLDRRGDLQTTRATILVRKDQAAESQGDPIYGAALAKTWSWLTARASETREVDFGIARFPSLPNKHDERAELCSPLVHAPILLPAHLDAWAQTQPRGEPDPDISLWLHGPQRGTAEVRVVWRADIGAVLNRDAQEDASIEEYASASLAAAPPSSLESISIPIAALRAWLGRDPAVDLADVEGVNETLSSSANDRDDDDGVRPFLIVTRSGAKVHRTFKRLYPDATVVVPTQYGGIRDGNWNPDATDETIRDLGDIAQLLHRGRPVSRLLPSVLCHDLAKRTQDAPAPPSEPKSAGSSTNERALTGLELRATVVDAVPNASSITDSELEPRAVVCAWLEGTRDEGSELWRVLVDALLASGSKLRVIGLGESGFFAVVGQRLRRKQLQALGKEAETTSDVVNDDDDGASYIGREVTLRQHLGDVEQWARTFATHIGLPEELAGDLALAARLHDIGKADPRFQQMLHGGSPVRMAASSELLAKSRGDSRDRAARSQAAERAKYPRGYRHELLSVAMLEQNSHVLDSAVDPDLVLHLLGSHHGWCRPFAPAVEPGESMPVAFALDGTTFSADTAHGLASLDSAVADRYFRLTERYGWWTLAWFEALLRLADHRASEESAKPAPSHGAPKASRSASHTEAASR